MFPGAFDARDAPNKFIFRIFGIDKVNFPRTTATKQSFGFGVEIERIEADGVRDVDLVAESEFAEIPNEDFPGFVACEDLFFVHENRVACGNGATGIE